MQLDDASPELDQDALAALPTTGAIGVALSGGGDSLALLHLLADWGQRPLQAVTVDHGLRPASIAEALRAGELATALGVGHKIFRWEHEGVVGNLQDAARTARRALIADWAKENGLAAVMLGHTADDQAETFLMRLARGSGLDGLASMDTVIRASGVTWVRPLLHERRETLRNFLRARGITWIDDPSNDDDGFERVRVRKALGKLGELGIDVPKIEKTTRRLKSAKQVLYVATKDLGLAISEVSPFGTMTMEVDRLLSAQPAIRLRLLSEAVRFISGSYYAPRSYSVQAIMDELGPKTVTRSLHGCLLMCKDGALHIRREPSGVEEPVRPGTPWDGRWMVTGPFAGGMQVAALGENGLAQCPDWRQAGAMRAILATTPAVWQGETLIAAPLVAADDAWQAELCLRNDFFTR